jgi:hypothetical protein
LFPCGVSLGISASKKMLRWKSLSVPEAVRARSPFLCIGSDSAALLPTLILILFNGTHSTAKLHYFLGALSLLLGDVVHCKILFASKSCARIYGWRFCLSGGKPHTQSPPVTKADWKIRSALCEWRLRKMRAQTHRRQNML